MFVCHYAYRTAPTGQRPHTVSPSQHRTARPSAHCTRHSFSRPPAPHAALATCSYTYALMEPRKGAKGARGG
jgi:hypothetical protein